METFTAGSRGDALAGRGLYDEVSYADLLAAWLNAIIFAGRDLGADDSASLRNFLGV